MTASTADRHTAPPLAVRVTADDRAGLAREAQRRGISRHALMLRAIRAELARAKQEPDQGAVSG